MEPTVYIIVTESGARLAVSADQIEVLTIKGKKRTTKMVPIDHNLLLERVYVNDEWELVVEVEPPKCE